MRKSSPPHIITTSVALFLMISLMIFTGCATEGEKSESDSSDLLASWGIDVKPDDATNSYLAGYAYGDVSTGGVSGEADGFLAKVDASGSTTWYRQPGTSAEDYVQSVVVAESGAIYVTGYTSGEMEPGAARGQIDCFVMKYDASGTQQWVRQLGSPADDFCWDMATDTSDNIYLVGNTSGVIPGSGATNAKGTDLFLIKLDKAGVQKWAKQLGTDKLISPNIYSKSYGVAVAVDSSSDIIVGGFTNDSIGGESLGRDDLIISKYNSAGDQTWIRQLGTTYGDYLTDIAVDMTSNAIYFTGYSYGTVDDSYVYDDYEENHSYTEIFLYKYDAEGTRQWVAQNGTATNDRGNALAIDPTGNVYLAGNTNGDLKDENAGSYDFFILKYSPTGTLTWEVQNGSSLYDSADGIAIDSSDAVLVTGRTYGELDSQSNSKASFTAFISKYNASGVRQWTSLF